MSRKRGVYHETAEAYTRVVSSLEQGLTLYPPTETIKGRWRCPYMQGVLDEAGHTPEEGYNLEKALLIARRKLVSAQSYC